MKLLVISDSHGNYPQAFKAHELAGPVDHIIHLGDGSEDAKLLEEVLEVPVLRVAGNCDCDPQLPRELTLKFGDCQVLVTHGNRQAVKSGLGELIGRGKQVGANLILYGHTHLPAVEAADGMLLINPGSLKEGGSASYAVITVEGDEVGAVIHGIAP
ncbi:phosphoesterase [Geomonas sp. Red276]